MNFEKILSREVIIGSLSGVIGGLILALIIYFVGIPMKYQNEVNKLRGDVEKLTIRLDELNKFIDRLLMMEKSVKSLNQSVKQLLPNREVSIIKPFDKRIIQYDYTEGNRGFFTVHGSSAGLKKGDYVSILLKIPGGDEWWHAGDSIKYEEDFSKDWIISMLSVDLDRSYTNIIAIAIISNKKLPIGQTYNEIPTHYQKSKVFQWQLSRK